jgi:hypothetical protein
MLPGVEDVHADDARGHESGSSAEDANEGFKTLNPANEVRLLLCSFVLDFFVEEKLLILVAGELSAIKQQSEEGYGEGEPDEDENGMEDHDIYLQLTLGSVSAARLYTPMRI